MPADRRDAFPHPRLLPDPLRTRRARHGAPAFVLVNGLTQYAELWAAYRDALVAKQFRVATFDLLGQGASDKPASLSVKMIRSQRYVC